MVQHFNSNYRSYNYSSIYFLLSCVIILYLEMCKAPLNSRGYSEALSTWEPGRKEMVLRSGQIGKRPQDKILDPQQQTRDAGP